MKKFAKRIAWIAGPAAVVGCVYAIAGTGGTSAQAAASPSAQSAAANVVANVLPGGAVGFAPTGVGSAVDMQISVPGGSATLPGSDTPSLRAPAPPGDEAGNVTAGELGWKAALAAGLAGQRDTDIVSYHAGIANQPMTPMQGNYLGGLIRRMAGAPEYESFPDIGSVPLQLMRAQLDSNVQVVEAGLPAGLLVASSLVQVPVDPANGDFAFEVNLKVSDLTALAPYVGDLVNGLGTGLVGGPTALAEGLAINVVDGSGRRASWWSAERVATGMGIADPALQSTGGSETLTFPNLTGGPAATSFGTGTAGASSSNGKTPRPYALSPGRGIGPVSIDDTKSRVERALGRPTTSCKATCVRVYPSTRGDLAVRYRRDRVAGITTTSGQITLGGLAVRLGPRRLHRVLRRWRYAKCVGYEFGSGPTTILSFRRGGSVRVEVLPGQVGGCAAP